MNEEEFLEKTREHREYKRLLEYQDAEQVDAAILRIKNGYGITESNYELRFYVESESITEVNIHFRDFMADISALFEKYKGKGITEGDLDRKGSTRPAALDIVTDTLNKI